jgi:hypothetical protein
MLYSLICGFVIITDDLSLIEVFQFFDLIHNVITDHNIVTRITKEVWFHIYYMNFVTVKFIAIFVCTSNDDNSEKQVIEDFASDNVVYLELRTTPKVIINTDPCVIRRVLISIELKSKLMIDLMKKMFDYFRSEKRFNWNE